ncbi:protein pinocchio-like [Dermacentor andersoni]|uniref:protein pinocchio-like n=1 Tax=Dermacentor andersoni TaxID=34620 RepID=UPI0021557CD8|nr:protein pinocchio-like [Dermacentor andersoni]
MASGVIVSYPSPALHESRPAVFKKDRRIRHSKSDPVLVALSHNSFARCPDRDNCWDSIEDRAQQQLQSDGSGAITLEGLKSDYNCCFTCGVSWSEDQACLDCSECGGYALQRPCPHCNGSCNGMWSRDLDATHKTRRAQWLGECKNAPHGNAPKIQDS